MCSFTLSKFFFNQYSSALSVFLFSPFSWDIMFDFINFFSLIGIGYFIPIGYSELHQQYIHVLALHMHETIMNILFTMSQMFQQGYIVDVPQSQMFKFILKLHIYIYEIKKDSITLYQINGWFVGNADCDFQSEELPSDNPSSSPFNPT